VAGKESRFYLLSDLEKKDGGGLGQETIGHAGVICHFHVTIFAKDLRHPIYRSTYPNWIRKRMYSKKLEVIVYKVRMCEHG
jgi:hypothetical protein